MSADRPDTARGGLSPEDLATLAAHFDADFYLAENPDVAAAGMDPLTHYVRFGEAEGRAPRADFNPARYRLRYPHLVAGGGTGRTAAVKTAGSGAPDNSASDNGASGSGASGNGGAASSSGTSSGTSGSEATGSSGTGSGTSDNGAGSSTPGSSGTGEGEAVKNLFLHYVTVGAAAGYAADLATGRRAQEALVARHMDEAAYLLAHPEAAAHDGGPARHYLTVGEAAGASPRADFDPAFYRAAYPDIAKAPFNLFWHYLTAGLIEGRAGREGAARTSPIRRAAEEAAIAPFFDTAFYLAAHPEAAAHEGGPIRHYLEAGEAAGFAPSADFDPLFYRADNPDLAHAPFNLFWHFTAIGLFQGRKGRASTALLYTPDGVPAELDPATDEARLIEALGPFIDPAGYVAMYPDVAAAGFDAVLHYVRHGEGEGRQPVKGFDPVLYRAAFPELAGARFNLFWHFIAHAGPEAAAEGFADPQALARSTEEFARRQAAARVPVEAPVVAPFFDADFYCATYPEAAASGLDPLTHYLTIGERAGLRPEPGFDPVFYRRSNPDLAGHAFGAFWHYHAHGKAELRSPDAYYARAVGADLLVSAIVPNFNHARFLEERIASIEGQTYPHLEIVILDDASTDDSREVIERLAAGCSRPVRTAFNAANAGNVFAQWEKGVGLARGDLVWICESDDFCEPDFAEKLVRHFRDESVTMAFGRIEFAAADGAPMGGMDGLRASAEPLDWSAMVKRPAAAWFAAAFGVRNVMANVGGTMFRRQSLPAAVWERAKTFKIAGDWYLYSRIAGGGQIVYEPQAVAYFRQHGSNTSASNFTKPYYWGEYGRIMPALCEMWDIPAATRRRFLDIVRAEFAHFGMDETHVFEELVPVEAIMAAPRAMRHLQIGFLGFHSGGGEVFAIRLAALMAERGLTVSLLAQNLSEVQPEMREMLPAGIPVYDIADMAMMGRDAYLAAAGIDIVHTHVNAIDSSFFSLDFSLQAAPYVVTLHGSHDFLDLSDPKVAAYVEALGNNASAVVYTADKNLALFRHGGFPRDRLFKVGNALTRDTAPFERTRAEMGIGRDAVVFTFVARGIERKGWRVAVMAFRALKAAHPGTAMHLILVGNGEKAEEAEALAGDLAGDGVTFLGYQSRVNGIYALSDVAILPTRYPGESAPLCLIQAAQEGLAIIASDIGEIANMLALDEGPGGALIRVQRDTEAFAADVARAMGEMLDPAVRADFARRGAKVAQKFSPDLMADAYLDIYGFAARRHKAEVARRAAAAASSSPASPRPTSPAS